MFEILSYCALMAGVFTFSKQIVLYSQPFFTTFIRMFPAGIIILSFQKVYFKQDFHFEKKYLPYLFGYSAGAFLIDSFRLIALQYLPAANAAIVATTAPLVTAIFAHFILQEKLTKKKIFALMLGFAAVLPVMIMNLYSSDTITSELHVFIGYCAMVVSTLGFVLASICIKRLTSDLEYPVMSAVGMAMLGAGVIGLFASILYDTWAPFPISNMGQALPILGILLVFQNLIAYPLFTYVGKKYPITLVSFSQLLVPAFTAAIMWVFYAKPLSKPFMLSFAVLSIALYLFYQEDLRRPSVLENK